MTTPSDDTWDSLVAQADAYSASGNAERLAEVAAQMVEHEPEDPLGYATAGDAAVLRGELKLGLKSFRTALEMDPLDDLLHYRIAILLRGERRFRKADEHIQEAIRLDPDDPDFWAEQAEICYWTDDEEGMEDALGHVFDLDPDHAEGLHLRARAADGAGIEEYEAALVADPEDAYVHHNLGTALLARGDLDRAEEHLLTAVRLDPTERDFRKGYYEVLKKRSWFYRWLRKPGEWLLAAWRLVGKINIWIWIALVLVGVVKFLVGPLLALTVIWALFFLPPTVVYNYLVISDIRAKAAEVGAPRGFLGLHRWSLGVRMGLFALLSLGLWAGLYLAFTSDVGGELLVGVLLLALGGYLLLALWGVWLVMRDWWINRRRRSTMASLSEEDA